MTKEEIQKEKELLLNVLKDGLPYGVVCNTRDDEIGIVKKAHRLKGINRHNKIWWFEFDGFRCVNCRPYLRPMSSMTEEEIDTYHSYCDCNDKDFNGQVLYFDTIESFDYLNSIHVDYRNLIPKGIALEAPEGMYKN